MQGLLGSCTSGEEFAGVTFHLSLTKLQFLSGEIALQKVEAGDGGKGAQRGVSCVLDFLL